MKYVIQIAHNRGVSYWHGDQSSEKTGFGCLAQARRYQTKDSAERDMADIDVRYDSVYYLGYLTESLEVKELPNEGKIIESDTAPRGYKR